MGPSLQQGHHSWGQAGGSSRYPGRQAAQATAVQITFYRNRSLGGLLRLIIIIKAIIKTYSPSHCPWMCPWLSILGSRHPRSPGSCCSLPLPPGEKFRCTAGMGLVRPCLASPPQRECFFPLITPTPKQDASPALGAGSQQDPSNRLVPMSFRAL